MNRTMLGSQRLWSAFEYTKYTTTKPKERTTMKQSIKSAVLGGIAAVLLGGGTQAFAQQERPNRGNFDPEQMRQRMMERYKEQLAVKDEGEWKIIQERIEKVTAARREVGAGGGFGMGFGGRRGGGGPGGGGDNAGDGGNRGGGGGGFRGEASPEAAALQKAIDSKAPAEEIKQKLAKLREARKEKEAKLEKAQEDLRKVLSVSQEASAVLLGLLK
jgi:hypothetical protein